MQIPSYFQNISIKLQLNFARDILIGKIILKMQNIRVLSIILNKFKLLISITYLHSFFQHNDIYIYRKLKIISITDDFDLLSRFGKTMMTFHYV